MNILKGMINLVGIILLLILSLSGFAYFLISTETGLRFIAIVAMRMMPLQIEDVTGSLLTGISSRHIHYRNSEIDVDASQVKIDWHWERVKSYRLILDDINANGLIIRYLPKPTIPDSARKDNVFGRSLAFLNSHMAIHHLNVHNIRYQAFAQAPLMVSELSLDNNPGLGCFFDLYSPLAHVSGNAMLVLKGSIKWDATLTIQHFNPVQFNENLIGNINARLTSKGEWGSYAHNLEVDINYLDGTLRGSHVSGMGGLFYADHDVSVNKFRLQVDKALLQVEGVYNKHSNLSWSLSVPDLHKLIPQAAGGVDIWGKLSGNDAMPVVAADIKIKSIHLPLFVLNDFKSHVLAKINPREVSAQFHLTSMVMKKYKLKNIEGFIQGTHVPSKVKAKVRITFNKNSNLYGRVVLPAFTAFSDLTQPIKSEMTLKLNNVADVMTLPEVNDIKGRASATVNISGNIGAPKIDTIADLTIEGFRIPALGVSIQHLIAHASNAFNQPIIITGQFAAGGGKADIKGSFNPFVPALPLRLHIIGDDLLVINLPEYKVFATPDVYLNYVDQKWNVTGKVKVPHAEIRSSHQKDVVNLPSEMIFVKANTKPILSAYQALSLYVFISLGEDILLAQGDLKGNLGGNVLIRKYSGGLSFGAGELHIIKGEYSAYNKIFHIQQGRIIYTGNLLTNPALDLRATQQVKTVTISGSNNMMISDKNAEQKIANSAVYDNYSEISVGVSVRGNVNKPKISLFSDPAMNQDDILSYILFGYPRSQISNASSLAILNMMAMSASKGGKSLSSAVQTVQDKLGLSQLSVGNTNYYSTDTNQSTNATTFNMAKNIGKKLTIQYSVGIFNPISIFGVRYQMNKYFSLQSQTSSFDNGVDLLYEYEH